MSSGSHTSYNKNSISVLGVTAIGVGGMMGAGLYTLIGLATNSSRLWLPLSFLIGGAVAAFSVYSYSKLGMKYPSRGGAAQFLLQGFGDGLLSGGMNVFQYLGWIIAMAYTQQALLNTFANYLILQIQVGPVKLSVSALSS